MRKLPRPKSLLKLRTAPKKPRVPKNSKGPIAVPQFDTRLGSSIEAHEYSPGTGHLTITYRGGRKYRYEGVSEDLFKEFMDADSKGRFLHSRIIGKFDCSKI